MGTRAAVKQIISYTVDIMLRDYLAELLGSYIDVVVVVVGWFEVILNLAFFTNFGTECVHFNYILRRGCK